jgi:feruloyl esterase
VLFTAVGVAHCFGGAGPSVFDGLTVMEDWVEHGRTPTRIVARQPPPQMMAMAAAMGILPRNTPDSMTRPMCPWPSLPRYKGAGDQNDAANFECHVPPN